MDPNFVSYPPQTVSSSFQIVQGMNPSQCAAIKTRGCLMVTLDAQYLTPSIRRDAREPCYGYIASTSSPSASFVATSSADIDRAAGNMFMDAIALQLTR